MVINKFKALLSMTKPRIGFLVLVVTTIGFFLGGQGISSWSTLLITLFGTLLCCGGAATLNSYLERDIDGLMQRTCKRPLPMGKVTPSETLAFGVVLVLTGTILLVSQVNLLTGFLAILTAFLYVVVYTPLKRITWLNTAIGAIPGALPPLGGWAAATGHLGLGAWVLFAILFLWQHPHFYAIAWMYRDDYGRAGFKMLPVVDPDGRSTFRQIIVYSCVLIPVSLLPTLIGMSGIIYFVGTLIAGISMLWFGIYLARSHSIPDARRLLHVSVIYLPVLLALIVIDSGL
jgi:protoheme IX farnesyltransferase